MSWYLAVLKKYAVFSGRARRKEYWMFFLFNILVSIALAIAAGFLGKMLGVGGMISDVASVMYSLAIVLPAVACGVRRMHDLGRSGWWTLFPGVNLVFLCLAGQPGDNEYGPDPKAEPPAAA